MGENLLELKNLSVTYTTDKVASHAVNNVSLTIKKGEILGLVGETGAGKTTTALSILKLLPRYTAKTSGEILFKGRDVNRLSEKETRALRGRNISMVFQDPMTSLNPVFRVGQQIGDVIKIHNKELSSVQIEERVDEMLSLVGVHPGRKRDYPHQFSGGMKQRVMLAIAMACKPELLIADEPTTALDVTIQAQIIQMMRGLQKELGSAVLLITHDLGVVANFCDNVAIMYSGEIIEYGTLEDVFDKNKRHHPYTEGLFGSVPAIEGERTSRLKAIDGLMPHPARLPQGCKFQARCAHCMDACKKETIPTFGDASQYVRCLLCRKEALV